MWTMQSGSSYEPSERFLLPLSHDEVVHGKASLLAKLPGDRDQAFANLRALYGWMFAHPGKKLLFMGSELTPWKEWSHEWELEWELLQYAPHRQIRDWLRALCALYKKEAALHRIDTGWDGFGWIDCEDAQRSVVSCLRRGKRKGSHVVVVANFTPVTWRDYRIGVPAADAYRILLNSDARKFGGAGLLPAAPLPVAAAPAHGYEQSLRLDLPPMAVLFLKPKRIQGKV